ncbi:MAG: hypothetical protein ABIP67_15580, partial [Burkholderiales bacterium]
AALRLMLEGVRFGSAVRAEPIDRRIIVLAELGSEQVCALDAQGLQPFAVVQTAPGVFEAAIRLVPSEDPEPSVKLQKMAGEQAAKKVGGRVSETIHLAGFFTSGLPRKNRRRAMVVLHRASRVVATLGAALLNLAREQLERLVGRSDVSDLKTAETLPGQVSLTTFASQPNASTSENEDVQPTEVFFDDWGR